MTRMLDACGPRGSLEARETQAPPAAELVGTAQGARLKGKPRLRVGWPARWPILLDPSVALGAEAALRNWEEELMLEKDLRVFTTLLVQGLADNVRDQDNKLENLASVL